jgi:hypothetical protein
MMFWKRKKAEPVKAPASGNQKAATSADAGVFGQGKTAPQIPPAAAPAAAPAQAPAAAADVGAIVVNDASQLVSSSGRPSPAVMQGEWCVLANSQVGRSAQSLPASEGDIFVATGVVTQLNPNPAGQPAGFCFGPIFLDAGENVLRWWATFDKPSTDASEVSARARAPAGTVSVRAAIRGPKVDGAEADYALGIRSIKVEKAVGA